MSSEKNPILSQKIEDVVFTIFDTETTGDNTRREDKPIEIAAVHWNLKKGFLAAPWQTLVDPKMPIHPAAIAVHGLKDEDVEGQPSLEDVLPILHDYIKDTILVAHNISFDLNMLPTLNEHDNIKIDSLRFVRQIFKIGELGYKDQDLSSHKMQELRYWLNLDVDTMGLEAHRAAADILVTGEVFRETLIRCINRSKCETVQELCEFIEAPIMIEKMNFGKLKGTTIAQAVADEIKKPKNYFSWLLKEVKKGNMKIDDDLKYTIEYHLKRHNINPVAFLVEESQKNWQGVINVLNHPPENKNVIENIANVSHGSLENNTTQNKELHIPQPTEQVSSLVKEKTADNIHSINKEKTSLVKDDVSHNNSIEQVKKLQQVDFDFDLASVTDITFNKPEVPKPSALVKNLMPDTNQIAHLTKMLSKKKVKIK